MPRKPTYEELRQRVEELELETRGRKYRTIFENTGTATVILEEDATIAMVNAEFEELSGYSKLEVEGRTNIIPFIAHRRDAERMLSLHWQRRSNRASVPRKFELDLLSRAGEIKNTFVTVDLIPETRQSVVSILDITGYKQLQEAYKQQRDYLEHILEYSPDGIAIANRRGEIVRFNRTATELSGYAAEEIRGRQAKHFYADSREMQAMMRLLRSQGSLRNYEIDFLRKDGERLPCSVSISLLRDSRNEVIGSVSIFRDLREWKEMLETVQEQEEKFKGIASSALDAVVMMDDQGRISYWNPAAEKIFGYTAAEAVDRDLHELIVPRRYHEAFRKSFPEFRRKGTGGMIDHSFELSALRKDGSELPVEVSLSALKLKNAWHSVGIVRDISERKIMEEQLRNMANTDQLTGAYNRHKFLECLEYEISRIKRNNSALSLVMLDIDHFKRINDLHGHNTGDEVLKELVRVIRNNLREVDILTRWGGEEFIVLAPDTNKLQAAALAERLKRTVSEHEFPGVGSVTISLGVTQFSPNESPDSLINRADERMYMAKRSGRNRVK
jgi:diguanylate cyclase (GGDEF)-like protein/PAS domain S-box-containing protein